MRANQNLICDNLLPKRDLLLQTRLVNDVQRYRKRKAFNGFIHQVVTKCEYMFRGLNVFYIVMIAD